MKTMDTLRFATRNSLEPETRAAMVELLQAHLASVFDLYSQTKQAHWNVRGPHFLALHEFFDTLAGDVLGYVDLIAERITALGGVAAGTLRMAAHGSGLPEYPAELIEGQDHLNALADQYGRFATMTRSAINQAVQADDQVTADLLTEITREMDKHLWFLEAHLEARN